MSPTRRTVSYHIILCTRIAETLTSRCLVAVACSHTHHQAICELGPSSPCGAPLFEGKHGNIHSACRAPATTYGSRSPFCFTFSKEATRSDNEPGNMLRGTCCCCGGCCSADGGRCASCLTPGGNCGSCVCACAAGGNGEEPSGCCGSGCGCGCKGTGDCAVSGTEVLGTPIDDTTGAGACHTLPD
jgi:hypothetical protein